MRRRQKASESVDDYVWEFEQLFEDSHGHWVDAVRAKEGGARGNGSPDVTADV